MGLTRRIRATTYSGDSHEYCTGWKSAKSESQLVRMVMNEMLDEWFIRSDKKIVIEEELQRVNYTVCPHCRGKMTKTDWRAEYSCHRCDRGWKRKAGVWIALFSAGQETYTDEEVREEQRHRIIREIENDQIEKKGAMRT